MPGSEAEGTRRPGRVLDVALRESARVLDKDGQAADAPSVVVLALVLVVVGDCGRRECERHGEGAGGEGG